MAKFLTTRGTTSQLEDIINTAQKGLVLISPFIRIPETLFQRIQDADRRNVSIKIVYGKSELQQEVMSQLKQLHNLSIYFKGKISHKTFRRSRKLILQII